MSPEAQRIAIAKACGWREIHNGGLHPEGFHPTRPRGRERLPDYLADLNAVHEAEKVLTGHQADEYTEILTDRVYRYHEGDRHWAKSEFFAIHATAAQRAEAFLKALGKWEDGK